MNRRETLRAMGRAVALGGLGLLAAVLSRRAAGPASREAPCAGGGRCGACPGLTRCRLPRGLSARIKLKTSRTKQ